mgnify:CR=1 FL=1
MARPRRNPHSFLLTLLIFGLFCVKIETSYERDDDQEEYISAVGDPGMRRDGLRVAIEAWNQCNEVGEEAPFMGSPRAADCFDVYKGKRQATTTAPQTEGLFPQLFFLSIHVVR